MIPQNQINDFKIYHRKDMVVLAEGSITWITDCPRERDSQRFAIDKCAGRVLIGGLGIGWIVEQLQATPEVTEIVVVEITQEIIDLVWQYLDVPKASIVRMDLKDYLETASGFDYIYIDIWPDVNDVSIPEWRKLAEQVVAPDRVLCWGEKKF